MPTCHAAIYCLRPPSRSVAVELSSGENIKQDFGSKSSTGLWIRAGETAGLDPRTEFNRCIVGGSGRVAFTWGCGCRIPLKAKLKGSKRFRLKTLTGIGWSLSSDTSPDTYVGPGSYLQSRDPSSSALPNSDRKAELHNDPILTLRRPVTWLSPLDTSEPPSLVDLAKGASSSDSDDLDLDSFSHAAVDAGNDSDNEIAFNSSSKSAPSRKLLEQNESRSWPSSRSARRPTVPNRDVKSSSSMVQKSDRAERLQNGMARHRTHSLTKPQKKNPAVQLVLNALRRRHNNSSTVAEVMEEHTETLVKGEMYVLLNELQRQHDWRSVSELFKWIKKQPWHRPSGRFYNMMIGFMGREGQPNTATLMFQEMLLERQEPNGYTFTALINAYGRARMFEDALAVFQHMKDCDSPECRPNTVTCNTLIGSLCRGRLYDQAVEIFLDMREGRNGLVENCRPSIVTYNTLIDALCRESQVDAAVDVLADLADGKLDSNVLPNTVTYNTIIDACGKAGNATKAEELVKDMEARGLPPDGITFTALIDAYGKGGLLEKAEATFRGMRLAGVRADVLAYTSLLSAYGRSGLLDRAEEVFEEMKLVRIEPNEVTYLSMIDAYGKAGNFKRAEEVFRSMLAAGHRPNVYTYSALMDAYGKCGEYKALVRTFEAMKREGCRPNLITYAALLNACGRCENWENALLVLYCLQQSGSEWELAMCRIVLGGENEEDLWENAKRMLEGMQQFSQGMRRSFYNALVDTLWSFGLRGRAARVIAVGRAFGVYGAEMFLYDRRNHLKDWQLDLHDSSIGAAAACFYAWLKELHLGWQWEKEVPERICIVTGWGKHTKKHPGDSPLKAAIAAELKRLGAPFEEDKQNPGRLQASGAVVRAWLLQKGMEKEFELVDTESPRPAGEMPYED